MKFSIRDLLLVTVIVTLDVGWWAERRRAEAFPHGSRYNVAMKYKPDGRREGRKSVIAFQVALNGKPLCLAGVGKNGVLTSIVQSVGGKKLEKGVQKKELRLIVGGLDTSTQEYLCWESRKIRVGDEVTIKVVESSTVDPPTSKHAPSRKP